MSEETAVVSEARVGSESVGRRRDDRVVGASAATQRAVEMARAAARTQFPVWIVGPPGSGKEFFARALHAWSGRSEQSFRSISCRSIPEGLQAREIFGCATGVHPGLPGEYSGALRASAGGSLLVDDAEALQPGVKDALLRAIADSCFRAEGESQDRPLTVRILLSCEKSEQTPWFAEHPHHELQILPLSERVEDVLPLAAHFLATFAAEQGTQAVGFTPDARAWLLSERWQGNVRELRERVRQAVALAGQGAISAEALLLSADGSEVPSFKEAKRAFETRYVVGLLRRCRGNISRAARLAKKDRKDFYDVIRRTGVDPQRFRG